MKELNFVIRGKDKYFNVNQEGEFLEYLDTYNDVIIIISEEHKYKVGSGYMVIICHKDGRVIEDFQTQFDPTYLVIQRERNKKLEDLGI